MDVLARVGEVFNKEGDPGPSSVLADLLPTLLRLLPLNVLILKKHFRALEILHGGNNLQTWGSRENVEISGASPRRPQ